VRRLGKIMVEVVAGGGSVGFMHPLELDSARGILEGHSGGGGPR